MLVLDNKEPHEKGEKLPTSVGGGFSASFQTSTLMPFGCSRAQQGRADQEDDTAAKQRSAMCGTAPLPNLRVSCVGVESSLACDMAPCCGRGPS
jgi:hypothetical protein